MRKCDDCKVILEDGVRFCPKCGKHIDAHTPHHTVSSEVEELLTSANLHRMRREFDQAAAEASKAIQLDPNDPDAAALLASIFEEHGDLAEAAVWSKIATDLDPHSVVHKAQLERVSKAAVSQAKKKAGAPRRVPGNPVQWALCAGAAALVLMVIMVCGRGGPGEQEALTQAGAGSAVRIVAPEATQARRSGSLPDRTSLEGRTPAAGPKSARTAGESTIKATAGQAQAVVSAGASVDDVIFDPRSRTAVATFSVPGSGMITKERIVRIAVGVARSVFAVNSEVQYCTARCIVTSSGGGGHQIGFVGDTARQSIEALPDGASDEQLSAAYTNHWWNQQIQ